MTARARLLVVLVGCVAALALSAAGASAERTAAARPLSGVPAHVLARPATVAATAEFLLHAGIAFYVFDHYIYKPYKAGDLHGFTHVVTIAKAALAALFVYHEVKVMAGDVKRSKLLSFLTAPIALAIAKLSSLKSAVTGGNLGAVATVEGDLGSVQQKAAGKGILIKEIVHAL
jgi:hypothetical protein